jgi:hypothetical protein
MGSLDGFAQYIDDRTEVIKRVEERLLALQQKYESFFQEVSAVRRAELAQLTAHISERRGHLPAGLDASLDAATAAAREEWKRTLDQHQAEFAKYAFDAEAARLAALGAEREAHQENVDLDAEEESLKARCEQVVADTRRYEAAIRDASRGFGFLVRLPALRSLQAERQRLEREQLDLMARIETLRARWAERAPLHLDRAAQERARWIELSSHAARVRTRVEYLSESAEVLIGRTALERVLFERLPDGSAPDAPNSFCARCGVLNTARYFCSICAARLTPDRPDLEGSLLEIAELNHHHKRFSDGMRACQELIALVGGIRSGLVAFKRSVTSMIKTQEKYPVGNLRLDVPAEAVAQGQTFETLLAAVSDPRQLHPAAFATTVSQATEAFGPEQLRRYFETMGHELSVQAKQQWG